MRQETTPNIITTIHPLGAKINSWRDENSAVIFQDKNGWFARCFSQPGRGTSTRCALPSGSNAIAGARVSLPSRAGLGMRLEAKDHNKTNTTFAM